MAPAAGEELGIPSGELPPLGQCRVWTPGGTVDSQPAAGPCAELRDDVPPGGWLVESPSDYPERIRVHVHDSQGAVSQVRLYDARSGRFLRQEVR